MSFEEDLEYGRIGENVARFILESSSKIRAIIDCSNDSYFQQRDIDYLAERKDGRILKCEVKTDRLAHRTGNIVWEKTTCGNIGCLEKTIADIIFYYLSENKKMYIFAPSPVRRYIAKTQPEVIKMGDGATGYLLKINELLNKQLLREVQLCMG